MKAHQREHDRICRAMRSTVEEQRVRSRRPIVTHYYTPHGEMLAIAAPAHERAGHR